MNMGDTFFTIFRCLAGAHARWERWWYNTAEEHDVPNPSGRPVHLRLRVNYRYRGQDHTILLPHNRRNPRMFTFRDSKDKDVTDLVLQYAGPYKDFHGHLVTPHDLGYDNISRYGLSGDTVVFDANTPIRFT